MSRSSMASHVVTVTRSAQFATFGQAGERSGLDGGVEDAEPAGQVLFDRELRLELRLELELLRVIPLLALAGGDEGPEGPALVAVDPVDRVLAALEAKDRRQELRAEPLLLEALGHGVHGGDLVLELRIVDDDPGEAELVLAALELRPGLRGDPVQQL